MSTLVPLTFIHDHFHNRTPNEWRSQNRSYFANQTAHAREFGYAGCWRADGSFQLLYLDNDRLRSKTWSQAKPATSLEKTLS